SACISILNAVKQIIAKRYNPDGFNVGININEAAGQTVPHVHIHLIPRYKGDVEQPRGGIRGVIPEKQNY
ncbi:MAG: HIT family protein, partial [Bacteroidota bacterium]